MIDKTAFYAMSYGLYLLTARRDGRDNGCIVDAVIQAASSPASVTISCMKENFTPEMIAETGEFNLSVLTENTPQEFFKHFGMQSGREADKFAEDAIAASGASFARSENGLIYTTGANAFVSCKVISSQDLGSHVQFTAEVTEAKTLSKDPSITYAFYRERLKKGAAAPAPAAAAVAASTSTAAPAATESTGSNAARTDASAEKNGENTMNKFICKVCGYIVEVEGELPEDFKCPVCGKDRSWFEKVEGELQLAAEHEYGVFASTVKDNPEISDEDKQYIKEQLMANFTGECSEVGMYLCMARIAHREGYPEVGLYWEKAAYEEAEHAAKFAELLGEELEPNMKATTKDNLKWRVECEFGATAGKVELATCAKKNGLDAIHDTVHEMARDEARHGKALKGLLERYFG